MDGARLQRLVARGYEVAGRKIGLPHLIHRPTDPLAPIGAASLVGGIPAAFHRAATFAFDGSAAYGKAALQGALDPLTVRVGDYLTGPTAADAAPRTLFVAALDHLQPPLVVECNAVVSVFRPGTPAGYGALPYGGSTEAAEVPLLLGWPASVLAAGAGEATNPHLPGDAKLPGWTVLLPALPGVEIAFSDIVRVDDGRRLLVSGAERSRLGWRLSSRLAQV